ncbi:MAG: hypothetical protein KY444_01655 [Gemmatimonadetes bacterium]|nr:hypothetical protein [Gemmatimonadota bacterium]
MSTGEMVLRAVLALLAVYHLSMGVASVFFQRGAAGLARTLYGVEMEGSGARFEYALRMLGVYALAFGFLLTRAAMDPAGHRSVIAAAILLQSLRAASRLASAGTLRAAFGVAPARNRLNAAALAVQAGLLAWFFP